MVFFSLNPRGGCEEFSIPDGHPRTVEVKHKGPDGWKGDQVKITFDDEYSRTCKERNGGDIVVDDDESDFLECN